MIIVLGIASTMVLTAVLHARARDWLRVATTAMMFSLRQAVIVDGWVRAHRH